MTSQTKSCSTKCQGSGGYLKAALTSIPLSFLLERIFLHDIKNSYEALSVGNKLQPVPRNSASDHNHGRLKSTVAVSGRGLPKIEIGTTSSTQMAVTSSRAGKRLVP